MHINDLFKLLVEKGGSDLHLKVGSPPILRIDGELVPMEGDRIKADQLNQLAYSILNEKQKKQFETTNELDFGYSVPGLARFRVNYSVQRGTIRIVARIVPFDIKTFEDLNLPSVALRELCSKNRGLVLITGPTGSGKSTTLAAMVDYINNNKNCHIVTVEDPIEFLYRDNKSVISQREVGTDTEGFASALKHVFRQDPDVILVGEMRDLETISTALTAAETGHFVLSTLHTSDAASTIDRIIDVFPPHQQNQIRIQLVSTLVGVISQKILPLAEGKGRVPATEVLIVTPLIQKLILQAAPATEIYRQIIAGEFYHMHTMNQSLVKLYKEGKITYEVAISSSPNPDEFKLNLKGIYTGSGTVDSIRDEKKEIPGKFEGRFQKFEAVEGR